MTDRDRAALIVAHPGHELVVHHWMERNRPLYCCLTDGSGGRGTSRLESTRRLLLNVGAVVVEPLFGPYTDREMYQLLLDGRLDAFVDLRDQIAERLIACEIDHVAGDAMEGFNPIHDICRALIDAAVRLAANHGRRIRNEEFALDRVAPEFSGLALDEPALQRKLAAANEYLEMRSEVDKAIGNVGTRSFAMEGLRPSSLRQMIEELAERQPDYEKYGELRVTAGQYRDVIRYKQHVLPVLNALCEVPAPLLAGASRSSSA